MKLNEFKNLLDDNVNVVLLDKESLSLDAKVLKRIKDFDNEEVKRIGLSRDKKGVNLVIELSKKIVTYAYLTKRSSNQVQLVPDDSINKPFYIAAMYNESEVIVDTYKGSKYVEELKEGDYIVALTEEAVKNEKRVMDGHITIFVKVRPYITLQDLRREILEIVDLDKTTVSK